MLPEDEATYLAIVFEETGAWQYKKNKELERGQGGRRQPGLDSSLVLRRTFGLGMMMTRTIGTSRIQASK